VLNIYNISVYLLIFLHFIAVFCEPGLAGCPVGNLVHLFQKKIFRNHWQSFFSVQLPFFCHPFIIKPLWENAIAITTSKFSFSLMIL